MITLLGILVLVLAVVSLVFRGINKSNAAYNASEGNGRYPRTIYEFFNKTIMKPIWVALVGVLLILLSIAFPFARNSYGYRQTVEDPIFKKTWVQFEQGMYWKGFFSSTTTYPNVITIVYADSTREHTNDVSFLGSTVEIRFSDAAKAEAEATVKWRLPNTTDKMLLIHQDNRSAQHLAETILEPYTSECLSFAAQLIESETHYSGGKSKMAEDFQSQLEDGQYIIVTKTEYQRDTVSNTNRKITETNVRKDKDGVPIRKKSNIKQYDIKIVSATIKSVDYDNIIDEKLKAKIEASTRESISKQLAITAEQEAITAERQGEKLIAETEAREQSAKREAVIRAEKEAEVAGQNLKRDKLNAEATLATKRAEAEGDRLKVIAGLSPLEQAKINKETQIGVAAALAGPTGIIFPSIVVNGGGNGGGNDPLQTLNIKMMYDLVDSMAKPKKK